MIWVIAIAVVIAIVAGILIARRNPKVADTVAAAANKAEDAAKNVVNKS